MSPIREIRCKDLDLTVNIETATIGSIACRKNPLMVGRCGYVAVEDRTTGGFHFRPEDNVPVELLDDSDVAVRQTDSATDIVLTQRFAADDGSIAWSAEAATQSGGVREIHFHFVIPVFGAASHGFTAHSNCPLVPGDGNDHMMVVYGPNMFNEESFHCSVLPVVASYDPQTDAGLAIIQPVEIAKPRMEYFFVREQADISLVVRWTHLRLGRGKTAEARMLLVPIRGCWRDVLRCVHDRYRDWFRVHEGSIFNHEGPMTGGELLDEDAVNRLVEDQGLTWQEIHANVFSHYGDYAPQQDSWSDWVAGSLLKHFDLERLSRTGFRDMRSAISNKAENTITRQELNDYIEMLGRKGVGAYLYTNPIVLSLDHLGDFPDSPAKSAEGTPLFHDYYRNAPMYPAADTTWGKHLDEMTGRALDLFPGIKGFFLDELHWNQFDFAHDDGVSARGDKPVAMIGFAVQDAARRICAAAHRRGKAVWANGPNTLEVVRYVDGFMAECSWQWLGSAMYLGLEKPVVLFIPNDWSPSKLEDALNACLFAGAQPGVIAPGPSPEHVALLRRYGRLFKILRGRKWILHPRAVTTEPPALRTNCFVLPGGDFAVTLSRSVGSDYKLVSADGYSLEKDKRSAVVAGPVRICLRWPGVEDVSSARFFSAVGPDEPVDLEILREAEGIVLTVRQAAAGVIRMSRQHNGGQAIRR